MKKKEIVVLDCGIEVRQEEQGILFNCIDPGREFAFGLKSEEIGDMIVYLNSYLVSSVQKNALDRPQEVGTRVEPEVPLEKRVAAMGVQAGHLAPPGAAKSGRVIPMAAVSVHK